MPFNVSGQTVITDDRIVRLSSGATGSRPGSPVTGQLWYNTTTAKVEVWNGAAWKEAATSGSATGVPPVWSWGSNAYSRLGDNTTTSKSSPVSIVGGFTDWIQVSSNERHTVALRANGTAWAWGSGQHGRLGNNATTNRSSPVSVVGGFTDWIQISAGRFHTAAIRANGTAWCWGYNFQGQIGNNQFGNVYSPVSVVGGFTDWIQISAGGQHTAAVRANGTVWCWGSGSAGRLGNNATTNTSSPVSVVGGFTDWIQISAGREHTMAIRANGTVWGWGIGSYGRLGNNATTNTSSPVSVVGGFTDWVQVSSGFRHSAAVRSNGTAWCWGSGGGGRIGNNTIDTPSSPVSVVGGFTNWVQISAGYDHTAAVRADGTVWGWGYGSRGQLGNNSTTNRSSPVSAVGGFTDWVQVSAGGEHSTAIRSQPRVNTIRPDRLRPLI